MRRSEKLLLVLLLLIHGGLLAWSAARHSPAVDEIGHLPAGLSHWKLQRFDQYNVNPPLVRIAATLPLHLMDTPIDLAGYQVLPRHRSEFALGSRWISSHPGSFLRDFIIARWACLPFSLLGAVTVFFWARDLYGRSAGFIALSLWCFCPGVLGHGSLITPDVGATAAGIAASYMFRKWLTRRTMGWAVSSGVMLGLALLTKFTWLLLLGLWPLCWLARRLNRDPFAHARWSKDCRHMGLIALLAFWVLNNGYLFEDSFQRLGNFQFSSQSLAGGDPDGSALEGDNRFRGTLLDRLPVPVPRNFLQGIDHIRFEYELGYPSYLRGVKQHGGWWYYYLYAMLVKMPVGTLLLIGVAVLQFVVNHRGQGDDRRSTEVMNEASDSGNTSIIVAPCDLTRWSSVTSVVNSAMSRMSTFFSVTGNQTRRADAQSLAEEAGSQWFETLYLLAPALGILWLVSSQTGFNHHLRYVLPVFPFLFIFASRTALLLNSRWRLLRLLPAFCVTGTIVSSLTVYPHSLSYFNELSGGSINGWKHLDNSNIDWGQDLIYAREWVEQHPDAKPLYVHSTGYVTPDQMGITTDPLPMTPRISPDVKSGTREFAPGWYIMGLTRIVDPLDPFHELLKRAPDGYIGYSMRIYRVHPNDGDRAVPLAVGTDPQH